MKNLSKLFGIATIAAVFAFALCAVIGCSNPAGGGSGNGGDSFPSPKGKLTVNGIDSFEGKYMFGIGMAGRLLCRF